MEWTLERVNGPKNFIVLEQSQRSFTCGRSQVNTIVCPSLVVSRKHCIFVRTDNVISVIDLVSSNGIYVNGEHIEPNVLIELHENDVIGIGSADEYRDNEPMFLYKLHKGNLGTRNAEQFDDLLTQRSSPSSNSERITGVPKNSVSIPVRKPQTALKRNFLENSKEKEAPVLPPKLSKLSDDSEKLRDNVRTGPSKTVRVLSKNEETPEAEEIHEIWSAISPSNKLPTRINGTEVSSVSMGEKRGTLNIGNQDGERKLPKTVKTDNKVAGVPCFGSSNLEKNKESELLRGKFLSPEKIKIKKETIKEEELASKKADSVILNPENSHKKIRFSLDSSSTNTRFTVDITETGENLGAKNTGEMSSRRSSEESEKSMKKTRNSTDEKKRSKELTNRKEVPDKLCEKSALSKNHQTTEKLQPERLLFRNEQLVANSSPFKLKHLKQEPMTSFSVIDTVDISDDDDDVFPSSQLFDSTEENSFLKVEDEFFSTKTDDFFSDDEERDKNRFADVDAANQESKDIITLSDSEDEDNIWLQRLSESQIIKEEKPDISELEIKEPESPPMEFFDELFAMKQDIDEVHKPPDLEVPKEVKIEKKTPSPNIMKYRRSLTEFEIEQDINNEADEDDSDADCDIWRPSEPRRKDRDELPDNSSRKIELSSKGPKIIEPLCLPQKKRHSLKDHFQANDVSSASPSTSKGRSRVRSCSVEIPKPPSNFSSKTKRGLQLEDRIKQKKYEEEQRIRRIKNKWAQSVPLPLGKRKCPLISKKEKLEIANERKQKLKDLAIKRKSESVKPSVERVAAKPKAKISMKNRGDFLINEQLPSTSSASNVEIVKSVGKSSKSKSKNSVSDASSSKKTMESRKGKSDSKTKSPTAKDRKRSDKKSKSSEKNCADDRPLSLENGTIELLKDLSLTQKENRVPNSLNKKDEQDVKKKKKKVTFSENLVTVRVFQINPNNTMRKCIGKDALIPKEKLDIVKKRNTAIKVQHPKLEEFLMLIFKWNPSWLEEQKRLKTDPPVVNYDTLIPLLTNYKSYSDYYQVLMPLLLLELWYGITKEFDSIDRNNRRQTMFCSIVNNSVTYQPIPSTNTALTTMMLEVLASEDDIKRQIHPVYGDLVFLELIYKDDEEKQKFLKVFAYVNGLYRTHITQHTIFNRDLTKHTRNASRLLTYTVLTRPLRVSLCINRILRLRCVTYLRANMRMVQALQSLPSSPLLDLILNPKIETYQLSSPTANLHQSFLVTRDKLNQKQIEAVLKTTEAIIRKEPKVCLVQGPPGTGKSEVIVNMVMQILYGDNRYKNRDTSLRILLCAPSNAAIDEIVLRLLDRRTKLASDRFRMVRVGLQGAMHPKVREISVEELAKRDVKKTIASYQSCGGESVNSVEEEKRFLEARINALQSELNNSQRKDENQMQYSKIKLSEMKARYDLMNNCTQPTISTADHMRLQRGAESKILICANIIACTLSSCYTNMMESSFGGTKNNISVCIVDEATQSCEAETLIPLMLGVNTLVLVGDPAQLPATVISQRAKKLGLDQSLFSRAQRVFDGMKNSPVIMLDVQYRMNAQICYWPNNYFYGSKLKTGVLGDRPTLPLHPYRVLNLDSYQNSDKFSNTQEAEFVSNLIFGMINYFESKKCPQNVSIGVITPYRNQQTLVQTKINQRLNSIVDNLKIKINTEVNTVDSFQGHERDVIIMSCVRSNGIGFLADRQRLCVALTRAKHCLILCGNFSTFQRDVMWRALLADAHSRKNFIDIRADARHDEILSHLVR